MGDDLNFAQKFTRTAADGLALLAEMPNPRAETEMPVVTNMMTTVQRGAKRLRARNIYVGAQNVLSALHHENDANLDHRIQTLGSLVTEYARGLDELLTQNQPIVLHPQTTTDKWETARETLNSVLPMADPDTADMLSRLMRAPVSLDLVKQDDASGMVPSAGEAEIVQLHPAETATDEQTAAIAKDDTVIQAFTQDDLSAQTIETPLAEAPKTPALPKTANISAEAATVALDAMMRDVVVDALSVARSVERTISLSYDMGERNVSEAVATDLRNRLGKAIGQIIRQAMTDDRVGHIDVNLAGEQLHIIAGTTAMRVAIDPKTKPTPKRLITQETEQGLRNQLDALMDPIAYHETAS